MIEIYANGSRTEFMVSSTLRCGTGGRTVKSYVQELNETVDALRARVSELEADNNDQFLLIEKQGNLLRGVAVAIKGEAPPLVLWSHHDLPELAAALRAENARLRAALEAAPTPTEPGAYNMGTVMQKEWYNFRHWFLTTRAEALK